MTRLIWNIRMTRERESIDPIFPLAIVNISSHTIRKNKIMFAMMIDVFFFFSLGRYYSLRILLWNVYVHVCSETSLRCKLSSHRSNSIMRLEISRFPHRFFSPLTNRLVIRQKKTFSFSSSSLLFAVTSIA